MITKKVILAIVVGFVLMGAGRYFIHGVWLAYAYIDNVNLWRSQEAMLHRLWIAYIADLVFVVAAVLIYIRGIEQKPWLGQGLRFGILLAFVSAVPQSLTEYFVYPITHSLALQWIAGEGALAVILGILIAAVCRPA